MKKEIIKSSLQILCLVFSVLCFISCDSNRIFEENKEIPDSIWDQKNKITFKIELKDTVSPHNVYINVRNAGMYPFSNVFLFITTTLPDGKTARDTAECTLADPNGKWMGDGSGDIWDNQILFKKNVHFPQAGVYQFEFEQAMRTNLLPGIMDVGLRIEKAK